nr:hypothetical protein [Pantoea stewartii]
MWVAIFKFNSRSDISDKRYGDVKLISIIAINNAALKHIKSEQANNNLVIRLLNVKWLSRIFNSLFYFLNPPRPDPEENSTDVEPEAFLRGAPAAFTPLSLTMKTIIPYSIPTDYSDFTHTGLIKYQTTAASQARYRPWLSVPIPP